jgi:asparagine synthase (glutamine-hydrolysing)
MGHRRLAVIDLSPAGRQPMRSSCGRFVLSYNGEIYNHLDLREELQRHAGSQDWRGHSDTETLLAALRVWGVDAALERLNGMFAFALWDRETSTLYLARDRMGEKPLYYGRSGGTFLFASQLNALSAHPDWTAQVDRDALSLFLRHDYVPGPWSIYEGIRKLPPATLLEVRASGTSVGEPRAYWSLAEHAEAGGRSADDDPVAMTDRLDTLLRDAVRRRMIADVPLGAFLSGGIDSATVVAMMQAQSARPVETFTIGFEDERFDEARHARAVAEHLGTRHTELYVTPDEAMAVIPALPTVYDEPFADSSQIPTFLVSRLARRHVTVSLSGDGGDELFAGYERYGKVDAIWRRVGRVPWLLRRLASGALPWDGEPGTARSMGPSWLGSTSNDWVARSSALAKVLPHRSAESYYRTFVSHWKRPDGVVLGADEPDTLLDHPDRLPTLPGLRERLSYMDMAMYLPDDILTKLDRASMAVSLESRVPLLDHRVVEFALHTPMSLKVRDGEGKWLLRRVLDRYVPKTLVDRPKMGFGVPIGDWLRGPFRDWAEALLDEDRLRREGYFEPSPIRRIWREHLTGTRSWHYYLWSVLMFQAWLDHQRC